MPLIWPRGLGQRHAGSASSSARAAAPRQFGQSKRFIGRPLQTRGSLDDDERPHERDQRQDTHRTPPMRRADVGSGRASHRPATHGLASARARVRAGPPRSGVRDPPLGQHAVRSRRRSGRAGRDARDDPASAPRPRSRQSGSRCRGRRCRAPIRGSARTSTGRAARDRGWRRGRRRGCPDTAAPRSVRMSPNRLDADDDVERLRVGHHARGQRVHVVLPHRDLRVLARDLRHHLVPQHHRMLQRVRLGGARQQPARPPRAPARTRSARRARCRVG